MRRVCVLAVVIGVLGCSDDTVSSEAGDESTSTESGDGDGDPGDGDGEPGDGDGEPGDGDGEPGDGDGEPGDGDGEPGDGDGEPGDGDGEPGDGDGEPGDGDGDPGVCDPSAFLGFGLADDGWGVGDFCDSVHVCADDAAAAALADHGIACLANEPECGPNELTCGIAGTGNVSQAAYDDACAAIMLRGVDAAWCVVWGP